MRWRHILVVLIVMLGCSKPWPANFWCTYERQLLEDSKSDQGPWGGFLAMYWHAPKNSTFSSQEILKFARNNGWKSVDKISISAATLEEWKINGKPYFPFSYTGLSCSDHLMLEFPRWISSDITIYRHKTGWLTVHPDEAIQTDVNGYIVVNSDSTQLSVYHVWGEL